MQADGHLNGFVLKSLKEAVFVVVVIAIVIVFFSFPFSFFNTLRDFEFVMQEDTFSYIWASHLASSISCELFTFISNGWERICYATTVENKLLFHFKPPSQLATEHDTGYFGKHTLNSYETNLMTGSKCLNSSQEKDGVHFTLTTLLLSYTFDSNWLAHVLAS